MKKLMLAALMGAAAMWFYDPANGPQRRDALQRTLNRGTPGPVDAPSPLVEPASIGDADPTPIDTAMFATR